jgi:hypothetical protein
MDSWTSKKLLVTSRAQSFLLHGFLCVWEIPLKKEVWGDWEEWGGGGGGRRLAG